jgi:peptidoglycan/xylan/chitin deacetylase (PgdA/CDA1 family)
MDFSAKAIRILFPSAIVASSRDAVHLTFDDGPHLVATPLILDVLRSFDVKATFFLLGENVQKFPAIARAIADERHTVGNHALNHVNLLLRSREFVRQQIVRTNEIIEKSTGITPTLFRPPYGYFDYSTLKCVHSIGMRLVHWSHDMRDFKSGASEGIVRRKLPTIVNGSIVLLHDNDATASTVGKTLPHLIRELQMRSLTFSSLAS